MWRKCPIGPLWPRWRMTRAKTAAFDCESQLTPGDARKAPRAYGHYYGATFVIKGRRDHTIALLWAEEDGYWKLVSWKTGEDKRPEPVPPPPPERPIVKIKADPTVVAAARGFLDDWLIRNDYDAAFAYFSPASYACYDLVRSPDVPATPSPASSAATPSRTIPAQTLSSRSLRACSPGIFTPPRRGCWPWRDKTAACMSWMWALWRRAPWRCAPPPLRQSDTRRRCGR